MEAGFLDSTVPLFRISTPACGLEARLRVWPQELGTKTEPSAHHREQSDNGLREFCSDA